MARLFLSYLISTPKIEGVVLPHWLNSNIKCGRKTPLKTPYKNKTKLRETEIFEEPISDLLRCFSSKKANCLESNCIFVFQSLSCRQLLKPISNGDRSFSCMSGRSFILSMKINIHVSLARNCKVAGVCLF